VGHRIGVITDDALTERMAGPAIRVWEIASALATEHDVRLVTTSLRCELSSPSFEVRQGTRAVVKELESWADVLVLQGTVLGQHRVLRSTNKVVVVDLYDPLHLEQLELFREMDGTERWASLSNATAELNAQLARGDFFLCASIKQRHFWLGQLAAVGRLNPRNYDEDETLRALIAVAPFGLPAEAPDHDEAVLRGVVPGIGHHDEIVLWGGGIYNWFDPLTLIRAVDRLRRRRPGVRLFFLGLAHPNPQVPSMRMATDTRRLAADLGLAGSHVFFNDGWVPYGERQNYLLEADLGVSTHLDHVETAYAFRTRILDYVWAGLPIVTTEGDALADLVARQGLGLAVLPGDVGGLEEALFRVLADDAFRRSCADRVVALRSTFSWPQVLEPLLGFCRHPRRAPDLVGPGKVAPRHRPRSVPSALWTGWRRDTGKAIAHLRRGDARRLADKLGTRLGRSVRSRR